MKVKKFLGYYIKKSIVGREGLGACKFWKTEVCKCLLNVNIFEISGKKNFFQVNILN